MDDLFGNSDKSAMPQTQNTNSEITLQKNDMSAMNSAENNVLSSSPFFDERKISDESQSVIDNMESIVPDQSAAQRENEKNFSRDDISSQSASSSAQEIISPQNDGIAAPSDPTSNGEAFSSQNSAASPQGNISSNAENVSRVRNDPPPPGSNPVTGSNPYFSNSSPMNYGVYQQGGAARTKPKMGSGLKAYLILIVGLIVVFVIGFTYECMRAYRENGFMGGDIDRFLSSDGDFGFNFGSGDDKSSGGLFDPFGFDDDESDEDVDSDDSFKDYDYVTRDDSDNTSEEIKKAPDKSTVISRDAAVFKTEDQPDDIDSVDYTARKAFKRVENSVVNVVVYDGNIGNEDYKTGSGTGIIISEDGYIVTNSHVINDSGTYEVEIILNDGRSYAAVIVGYDSRTDLAVLKIDESGLLAAEFVDSNQIEVGQDAIAVGNPGGTEYSNSLTKGCVSALNRTVSSNRLVSYIQTDAAINPGNSGGPLLNSAGQVMGITTIKIANTNYEGMGFAIPSNTVIEIVNDLVGQGYVSNRVRLGITGIETSSSLSIIKDPEGIVIDDIAEDGSFAETDVQVGDIITAIDGEKVSSFTQLFSALENYQPGDKATVSIFRPGTSENASKTFDVEITLMADNGETQQYRNSDN